MSVCGVYLLCIRDMCLYVVCVNVHHFHSQRRADAERHDEREHHDLCACVRVSVRVCLWANVSDLSVWVNGTHDNGGQAEHELGAHTQETVAFQLACVCDVGTCRCACVCKCLHVHVVV